MKKIIALLIFAPPLMYGCGRNEDIAPKKTEVRLVGEVGGNHPKAGYIMWRQKGDKVPESFKGYVVGNKVEVSIFAESGEEVTGGVNLIDEGIGVKDFLSVKLIANGQVVVFMEDPSSQNLVAKYIVP